jgi:hypothetical protein
MSAASAFGRERADEYHLQPFLNCFGTRQIFLEPDFDHVGAEWAPARTVQNFWSVRAVSSDRSPDAFYYRTMPFSRKGDSTLTVAAMFFMVEAGLGEL